MNKKDTKKASATIVEVKKRLATMTVSQADGKATSTLKKASYKPMSVGAIASAQQGAKASIANIIEGMFFNTLDSGVSDVIAQEIDCDDNAVIGEKREMPINDILLIGNTDRNRLKRVYRYFSDNPLSVQSAWRTRLANVAVVREPSLSGLIEGFKLISPDDFKANKKKGAKTPSLDADDKSEKLKNTEAALKSSNATVLAARSTMGLFLAYMTDMQYFDDKYCDDEQLKADVDSLKTWCAKGGQLPTLLTAE